MQQVMRIFIVLLVGAMAFSSCTCHKDVPPPPTTTTMSDSRSGWGVKEEGKTPVPKVQTPTAVPTEPVMAEAQETPEAGPAVPDDFPVPVFEGAEVAQVQPLANNAHNVIFHTAASVGELYTFYEDKLTSEGWKLTQSFQRGPHAFMTFRKDELIANVTIADDPSQEGRRILAVMYEAEKPLEFDEF